MVLGAQQRIVLPPEVDRDTALAVQQRLSMHGEEATPRKSMLFISQSQIMCFSLSVACFLAGLSSVVVSPLAQSLHWGPETKVAL